jgi:hypothetical protein
VPGDLLQHGQQAVVVFQFPDPGVAQLVEGPAGGRGEAFGCPPVGQACPAGGGVEVEGGDRQAGPAVGEEQWSPGPSADYPGEQVGGVGVPIDLAGDPALAGDGGGLVLQVEVADIVWGSITRSRRVDRRDLAVWPTGIIAP